MLADVTWVDILAGSLLLISAVLIAVGASNARPDGSGLAGNPYMAVTGIGFLAVPVGFVFLAESTGVSAPGENNWAQYAAGLIFSLTIMPTLRGIKEDIQARRAANPKPKKKPAGPVDPAAEASRARMFERTEAMHTDWLDRLVLNWNHGMVPDLLTAPGAGTVLAAAATARQALKAYEKDLEPVQLQQYRSAVMAFRDAVEHAEREATRRAREDRAFGPEAPLERRGKLNLLLDGFTEAFAESGGRRR